MISATLYCLLVLSGMSFAQTNTSPSTDEARKKIVFQYISEYEAQKKSLVEKVNATDESKLDVKKDKEKYCKYYSDLKASYKDWEKAYSNLNQVYESKEISKFTDEATFKRVLNIIFEDKIVYEAVGNSAKDNFHDGCMSDKEKLDELMEFTKQADKYNKAMDLRDIVKSLGDLKPYFAAKVNLKTVGTNPNSTPADVCSAITGFKRESDAIEDKMDQIYELYKALGAVPRYVDALGNDAPDDTKRVFVMLSFREKEFLPLKETTKLLMVKYGCK